MTNRAGETPPLKRRRLLEHEGTPFISRKCCALDCRNSNTSHAMFTFPSAYTNSSGILKVDLAKVLRCREWVKLCGNGDLLDVDPTKLNNHYFLCSEHFCLDAFEEQKLKNTSIPKYFAGKQINDELMQIYDLRWQIPVFDIDLNVGGQAGADSNCTLSSEIFASQLKDGLQTIQIFNRRNKFQPSTSARLQTQLREQRKMTYESLSKDNVTFPNESVLSAESQNNRAGSQKETSSVSLNENALSNDALSDNALSKIESNIDVQCFDVECHKNHTSTGPISHSAPIVSGMKARLSNLFSKARKPSTHENKTISIGCASSEIRNEFVRDSDVESNKNRITTRNENLPTSNAPSLSFAMKAQFQNLFLNASKPLGSQLSQNESQSQTKEGTSKGNVSSSGSSAFASSLKSRFKNLFSNASKPEAQPLNHAVSCAAAQEMSSSGSLQCDNQEIMNDTCSVSESHNHEGVSEMKAVSINSSTFQSVINTRVLNIFAKPQLHRDGTVAQQENLEQSSQNKDAAFEEFSGCDSSDCVVEEPDTSADLFSNGTKETTNPKDAENICHFPSLHSLGSSNDIEDHTCIQNSWKLFLSNPGVKSFIDVMKNLQWRTCNTCKEKTFHSQNLKRTCTHAKDCITFSAERSMDPGPVPPELQGLTYIEEQLIARVHPVISVYKIRGLQLRYSGNVINFPQAVEEFAKVLPWKIEDLPSVITVRTGDEVNHSDFYVRAAKVKEALNWLQKNNIWYYDIEVSDDNLSSLPENGNVYNLLNSIGTSSEPNADDSNSARLNDVITRNITRNMKASDGNRKTNILSGTENECDDDCSFDDILEETGVPMLQSVHQDDHIRTIFDWPTVSGEPISEFKTKGYIPKAFPTLFPHGYPDLRGHEGKNMKPTQYFKHLMQYEDQRFAKHPRFRFFAFNSAMRWRALSEGTFYVNKNSDLKNKTAEQLKRLLQSNPSALKNIMFYGNKLRGTQSFWKLRSYELLDMIDQLGLPTLFITLSAADYHWPDLFKLLVPNRDSNTLTEHERRKLIEENPLIVDSFFLKRVKEFFEKVVGPKLQVRDFWYRIEYQHRGSPHIHGLLWLADAPDVSKLPDMSPEEIQEVADYFDRFVCCFHPSPSTPPANDEPCRRRVEDIVDPEQDLAELLNRVQMHNCTKAYCKRKNKKSGEEECRFKFPQDYQEKSKIQLNEDGIYEFLGKRNVDNLNKYNKDLIQLWRANMDLSPILSYRALVMYLVKYVSKFEPKSVGLEEFLNSCALDEKSAKSLVHKILIRSCSERDFSAQEVCHLLMGLPLTFCSRDFVFLNLKKSTDWIPMDGNENCNEDNPSNGGKSIVQKYVERNVHFNLSLWEVAQNFLLPSGRRRSKPAIVRIVPKLKFRPDEDNENYYRQQSLLHLPWNNEESLLQGSENWKNVYDKNNLQDFSSADKISSLVTDAQKDNNDDDDLVAEDEEPNSLTAEEYMRLSAMRPNAPAQKTELGRREIDLNFDWNASAKNYEQYGPLGSLKTFVAEKRGASQDPAAATVPPDVTFNEQQKAVLTILEAQISSLATDSSQPTDVPKRIIIQGKAGTGKSLLIQAIKNKLEHNFGLQSFLLLAPTGIAALNINGSTIHSGLSIHPTLNCFKALEGEKARLFCDKMAAVNFLIIDEYSMVGAHMLSLIDERLRQGKGSNEDFGGLFVYLLGDIRQLPPVGDAPLYQLPHQKENLHKTRGKMLFSQFDGVIELTHCHRQTDQSFIDLLNNLSVGESTDQDYEVLKSRFYSRLTKEEKTKFQDAIQLFPRTKQVNNLNQNKLASLKCPISGSPVPVARIPAKNNCQEAACKEEAEGLFNVLTLAVGCKVMLRTNLWTSKGLVNGAIGTVVDIVYDKNNSSPDSPPEVIICSFPSYCGPYLDDNLKSVPIPAISRYWTSNGIQCSRKQFALSVAYACTVHKSQGLTLSQVVIDIGDKEDSCGLTYVAISRVKQLSGLILADFPKHRITDQLKSVTMKMRTNREKDIFSSMKNINQ